MQTWLSPGILLAAAEIDERDFPLWPFFVGPLVFLVGVTLVWKARKR